MHSRQRVSTNRHDSRIYALDFVADLPFYGFSHDLLDALCQSFFPAAMASFAVIKLVAGQSWEF